MKNYTHKSKYFYGNKISEYGIKNGYVDYRTLSKAFEGVLCNDITRLFYSEINGEYNEVEQVNGFIDNRDEIEEAEEKKEALTNLFYEIKKKYNETEEGSEEEKRLEKELDETQEKIDEQTEIIEELEREQDEMPEIYQYYIIDDNGAEILKDLTDEIVYYLPVLDFYVWGVTHWGTAWDYVLTNIKIEIEEENGQEDGSEK